MTHRLFTFLLNIPSEADDASAIETAKEEFFLQYADPCLRHDNNWHWAIKLVLRDGRAFKLVTDEEYGGSVFGDYRILDLQPEQRWQQALLDSILWVAYDVHLLSDPPLESIPESAFYTTQTYDEFVDQLNEHIPRYAVQKAQEFVEIVNGKQPISLLSLDTSDAILAAAYWEECAFKPFSPITEGPDNTEYRAFDIREDSDNDDNVAILYVVIHT